MKKTQMHPKLKAAFVLIELLIIIAVLTLLVLTRLPAFATTKAGVQRLHCSDNLKRVGVAFRSYTANHQGRVPMWVAPVGGGASSAVGIAASAYGPTVWSANYPVSGPRGVFGIFAVMSNELATPKFLYCPAEVNPHVYPTQVFGNDSATNAGFNSDSCTSYFVGVDASEYQPTMILAGDHNLGYGVNQATPRNQFTSAGTNLFWPATALGWQDNQHRQQGNVLFADGSVQALTTAQFRDALNRSGDRGRTSGIFSLPPGSSGAGVNRLQFPRSF